MSDSRRGLTLPRLQHVGLHSFSLYKLRPSLDVSVDDGVFCLAGANGLGKSSFIAALSYAITGGVAPPSGRVEQLPQYRRDATNYSKQYFAGRIQETDRGSADISVQFVVGDIRYELTRGFFEPNELRFLSITTALGDVRVENDPTMDAESRNALYEEHLVMDVGVETFAQFMFLQHFVLAFDERRHLLFWNTRASELVLYLALGLDPGLARRADELRKAASAAGSLARNAQYQATTTRQEIRRVQAALDGEAMDEKLIEDYRSVVRERDEAAGVRQRAAQALADARLEYAEAAAKQMRIRTEYEEAFSRRRGGQTSQGPSLHPLVAESLSDHRCRICGTQHDEGPLRVARAIEENKCPLCAASLSVSGVATSSGQELQKLDRELLEATDRSRSLAASVARLEKELKESQKSLTDLQEQVAAIEGANDVALVDSRGSDISALRDQVQQLNAAVDVALSRKDAQLDLRSKAMAELEPIQGALQRAWHEAEVEFVPRFRRLAERFIGLPLQVQLDTGSGAFDSAHLALVVDSTHRRNSEQLSESQRFFLDIALRMSIVQHMTRSSQGACIYVDTPEGALDIAYEARAGEMFSRFVKDDDQIVMTANVNSSQLLRRMARRCGRERMKLVRMTDWTSLSDVQIEEEDLFDEAYAEIEAALDGTDGTSDAGVGKQ